MPTALEVVRIRPPPPALMAALLAGAVSASAVAIPELAVTRDEAAGIDRYEAAWTESIAASDTGPAADRQAAPDGDVAFEIAAERHLCWDAADHDRRAITLDARASASWGGRPHTYQLAATIVDYVGGGPPTVHQTYRVDGEVVAIYEGEVAVESIPFDAHHHGVVGAVALHAGLAMVEIMADWLRIDRYCLRVDVPQLVEGVLGVEAPFDVTVLDWREAPVEDAHVALGPPAVGTFDVTEGRTDASGEASFAYLGRREGPDHATTTVEYSFYRVEHTLPRMRVEPWVHWFIWATAHHPDGAIYLVAVEHRGPWHGSVSTLEAETRGDSLYIDCPVGTTGRVMSRSNVLRFDIDEPPVDTVPPWDGGLFDEATQRLGSARYHPGDEGGHPAGWLALEVPVPHPRAELVAVGRADPVVTPAWRRVLADIRYLGSLTLTEACRVSGP